MVASSLKMLTIPLQDLLEKSEISQKVGQEWDRIKFT